MLHSMTGFGRASTQVDGVVYAVEVKSVNNRHFKAYLRLPDTASFLNEEIEKLLNSHIDRGTVNFSLRLTSVPVQSLYEIDAEAIKTYAKMLQQAGEEIGMDKNFDLSNLLSLPGIIQPIEPDEEFAQTVKATVMELTEKAVQQLTETRQSEGKLLAEHLLSNCAVISDRLKLIAERSPQVVEAYHQKLAKRVDDLLSGGKLELDSDLLAREVAIFADRSDIAEEISRLDSHLRHFEKVCNGEDNGNGGRRLDFICQEMLRETNTIGSKACDAEIAGHVIDIKCAIDRLKEQVQNVE